MLKHLRAGFLLFHLVAIGVMAVPAPTGGMNRNAWKDPTVQAEFDSWHQRLTGLGLGLDRVAFEDRLWRFAEGYNKSRRNIIKPFKPYYDHCGTYQSWRMFVAPHRFPARLEVAVEQDGAWNTVYVARSPEHHWLAPKLNHDRFRSAVFRYGWSHYRKVYRRFVDWLATRAEADFPDATRLRVRFLKYRTPSPQEARRGMAIDGKYIHTERRVLHEDGA